MPRLRPAAALGALTLLSVLSVAACGGSPRETTPPMPGAQLSSDRPGRDMEPRLGTATSPASGRSVIPRNEGNSQSPIDAGSVARGTP